MTTIGFIGLGHMGYPMTLNLIKNYQVKVYDINKEAVKALNVKGAQGCKSLFEVASDADVIFTMLQTGQQVYQVFTEKEGLFNSAKKGTLFIDSSSIDIKTSRLLHAMAKDNNFPMLDAPVSGGVVGAENATLTFMVGGEASYFNKAQPILQCMGKTIVHAGNAGNGQAAKICNNMLLGISMIGVCEAFTLGEKLGLDPKTFFEISSHASGQCWSMTQYAPVPGLVEKAPSNRDFKPGFTSQMMLKDLRLSQQAAEQVAASTPLGAEATMLYSLFVNLGNAQLDFSGIIQMLRGQKL